MHSQARYEVENRNEVRNGGCVTGLPCEERNVRKGEKLEQYLGGMERSGGGRVV